MDAGDLKKHSNTYHGLELVNEEFERELFQCDICPLFYKKLIDLDFHNVPDSDGDKSKLYLCHSVLYLKWLINQIYFSVRHPFVQQLSVRHLFVCGICLSGIRLRKDIFAYNIMCFKFSALELYVHIKIKKLTLPFLEEHSGIV